MSDQPCKKVKKRASKVAHNRPRPFYFTAQNWFFILWNLGTRHLFSYLWLLIYFFLKKFLPSVLLSDTMHLWFCAKIIQPCTPCTVTKSAEIAWSCAVISCCASIYFQELFSPVLGSLEYLISRAFKHWQLEIWKEKDQLSVCIQLLQLHFSWFAT